MLKRRGQEVVRVLASAAGIGAIAGLRSMTAPAVVGWAVEQKWVRPGGRRLRFLKSRRTALILSALAVGELVVDKLPRTPDRTQPVSLLFRAISGGACAAVLCAPKSKLVVPGTLLGAAGAIAGSFAGYRLRKKLDEKVNDTAIALAEDAVASGCGLLLTRVA